MFVISVLKNNSRIHLNEEIESYNDEKNVRLKFEQKKNLQ
jgi:hypothetical protein